ncbi:hypothetical protein RB195_017632 [Necator americanus]|uniref:Uncharacterized protein n=1 Tax=Necator americanus TaxID=51031 RepID=A0ABR1C8F4_NECAM
MRIYGASPEVSMVLLMNIPRPFDTNTTATFSIQSNGLSISWDGYTKGCASIREDNAGVPTSTCYDISTTNQGGYTKVGKV